MNNIRNVTRAELDQVLQWAKDEGWNPGRDDAAAFFAADPDGFFVGMVDETPVAAISVVNHNESYAFLGLYIVRTRFRGKGIGYGLWQHAIGHAGSRTVGLDGVPEQQANYGRSGFQAAGGTTRFSGRIEPKVSATTRSAQPAELEDLIQREAEASGQVKTAYLSAWFRDTMTRKTLVADGGFCTVRQCQTGAKIGPLISDSPESARRLLQHSATFFGPDIVIDVPDRADGLSSLCHRMGLLPGFQTTRMYRGPYIEPEGQVYAVASLELG